MIGSSTSSTSSTRTSTSTSARTSTFSRTLSIPREDLKTLAREFLGKGFDIRYFPPGDISNDDPELREMMEGLNIDLLLFPSF